MLKKRWRGLKLLIENSNSYSSLTGNMQLRLKMPGSTSNIYSSWLNKKLRGRLQLLWLLSHYIMILRDILILRLHCRSAIGMNRSGFRGCIRCGEMNSVQRSSCRKYLFKIAFCNKE
jgi:hypothetical protein